MIVSDSRYDLNALESKLIHYLNNEENFSAKFDIDEVPVISNEELKSIDYNRKINKLESSTTDSNDVSDAEEKKGKTGGESSADNVANDLLRQQQYAQELSAIAEFEAFGKLTKSTANPVYLTDKENEIVVSVVKHLFVESQKLVLQYNINNTLPHTVLEDISVIAQPDNELYQEDFIIPLGELKPDQTGIVYVAFSTPSINDEELLSAFGNTVAYTNKDLDDDGNVDPTDDGWSDEYQIDDLELLAGDFIIPLYNSNFTAVFDQLSNVESGVVNISNVETIENAVTKLRNVLNMLPLDGSDYVPSDSTSHTLKLLGKDAWGGKVGASIRLAATGGKIVAKVETRTETDNFGNVVINSVY